MSLLQLKHTAQAWASDHRTSKGQSQIKKIDTEALRRAMKRMKGKKVHGVDNIDS